MLLKYQTLIVLNINSNSKQDMAHLSHLFIILYKIKLVNMKNITEFIKEGRLDYMIKTITPLKIVVVNKV